MAIKQQCQLGRDTQNSGLVFQNISGNLNPKELYKHIKNSRGKPDRVAIDIMSDVIYWYRPKKNANSKKFNGDAWQTSYEYFIDKFYENRERIRRALVKLEEMNLIQREFRTIYSHGRKCNNVLFIHLNIEKLSMLLEKRAPSLSNFEETYPQNEGDYIKETKTSTKIENNRSMDLASNEPKSESNFLNLKKSFSEVRGEGDETQNTNFGEETVQNSQAIKATNNRSCEILDRKNLSGQRIPYKRLADYLPLREEDGLELCQRSGRDFSLNAMNEILQSVSSKIQNRKFLSKSGFLSYAAKVLENEMRSSEKINNKNFRIKSNYSKAELDQQETEQYLESIENSRNTSLEMLLKKKLISVFESQRASQIIKGLNNISDKDSQIRLVVASDIGLTIIEQEILIDKTIEVYSKRNLLTKDQIKIDIKRKQFGRNPSNIRSKPNLPNNIWGRVRASLIDKYGAEIDKSWFSRVSAKIDKNSRRVNLETPSEFISSWINREYGLSIANSISNYGFELGRISAS